MSIDVRNESLCTPAEAAQSLPDGPHPSTVTRWILKGSNGVRLESIRFGRRIYTSHEALARFGHALAEASQPANTSETRRCQAPSRRVQAVEQAEQRLARDGF